MPFRCLSLSLRETYTGEGPGHTLRGRRGEREKCEREREGAREKLSFHSAFCVVFFFRAEFTGISPRRGGGRRAVSVRSFPLLDLESEDKRLLLVEQERISKLKSRSTKDKHPFEFSLGAWRKIRLGVSEGVSLHASRSNNTNATVAAQDLREWIIQRMDSLARRMRWNGSLSLSEILRTRELAINSI